MKTECMGRDIPARESPCKGVRKASTGHPGTWGCFEGWQEGGWGSRRGLPCWDSQLGCFTQHLWSCQLTGAGGKQSQHSPSYFRWGKPSLSRQCFTVRRTGPQQASTPTAGGVPLSWLQERIRRALPFPALAPLLHSQSPLRPCDTEQNTMSKTQQEATESAGQTMLP